MTVDKGISIQNIYYMLAYAFHALHWEKDQKMQAETFENTFDLLSYLFTTSFSTLMKRGLYRHYQTTQEDLSVLQGKIDVDRSIRNSLIRSKKIGCEFDEYTTDNIYNQIIKTTALIVLRKATLRADCRKSIKRNLAYLGDVSYREVTDIPWSKLIYQRNNRHYRVILNLCWFLLDGLLLTTTTGQEELGDYLDDRKMHELFEKFILEYYRYHYPQLNAHSSVIPWQTAEPMIEYLPKMVTDVTLSANGKTVVIDAKYYKHILVSNREREQLRSSHIYQIFSYVKNMDPEHTGNTTGVLLYAATGEDIPAELSFTQEKNTFLIRTLNLSGSFDAIREQLNTLAEICL